jgi:hypothetical protein
LTLHINYIRFSQQPLRMRYLVMMGFLLGSCILTLAQENLESSEVIASEFDVADAQDLDQLYVQSLKGSAKIISKAEFEKLSANEIAYISIINDERSTYIYGDKAKNGVVLVVMKNLPFFEKFSTRKRRQK